MRAATKQAALLGAALVLGGVAAVVMGGGGFGGGGAAGGGRGGAGLLGADLDAGGRGRGGMGAAGRGAAGAGDGAGAEGAEARGEGRGGSGTSPWGEGWRPPGLDAGSGAGIGGTAAGWRDGEGAGSRSRGDALDPYGDGLDDEDEEEDEPVGVGLRGDYWKYVDEPVGRLPAALPAHATVSRLDPMVWFPSPSGFDLPFVARNLVVKWRGFVRAPEDGAYTFVLGSDDGSRLTLDGRVLLEMNHMQPYRERSVDVVLSRGFHSIEVYFFQNEGPAACTLQWVPPAGPPGPVPTEHLFPGAPPQAAPRIAAIEPPRARRGQVVTIRGDGFPVPGEPFEVMFAGRRMEARLAEDGTILATIPPGIARGDVFLHVRESASEGFPYEVGDVFGLLARYRVSPDEIPSFEQAPLAGPASFERIEPELVLRHTSAFALPFPARQFAAVFEGSLYSHSSGPARLVLDSDDGSRLFLDGTLLIDNAGLHPMVRRQAELVLTEGFHTVRIDYFQNHGGAGIALYWDLLDGKGTQRMPLGTLYPPSQYEVEIGPRIAAIEPDSGYEGDEVEITGEGFGFDPFSARLTFSGVEAEVVSLTPERIICRVPVGASTGPVVFQTGPLASEPVDFEVLGRGLRARYYQFQEDLSRMPDLAGLVPDIERIDAQLLFGEGYSFGLPFEAERFAAVWTGSIDCPADGDYSFSLYSDDGSRLFIDGALVVDNDGLHGHAGKNGHAMLTKGRHTIRVEMFQNYVAASLDLLWTTPGRGRRRVPGSALFPD